MERNTFIAMAIFALSGCVPDAPDAVDGADLRLAYNICIRFEDELIADRIACTQAVYGGRK
jgi:hypothetical protein